MIIERKEDTNVKKRYEELEMEVIRFGSINTSTVTDSNGENPHEGEGEDKFDGDVDY